WQLNASTVNLCVDGVSVGSAGSSSGTRASNSSGLLSIGHGPAVAGRSWNGRMAMVAFYNYVLTPTQISNHYSAM
ncbi:hypothetical protein KC950_04815, partial [Candidatus Saccharibacteria bacterium]|nr:hypothetical protein [Candidatus Saccharibacteria bacterium]